MLSINIYNYLWPIFYVDTTTNRNLPTKNCVLFVSLYALDTNMNQTHHQPLLPCCLFSFDFVPKKICSTAFCVHYCSASARINLKTLYLFDINCHFHALFVTTKHKCSF